LAFDRALAQALGKLIPHGSVSALNARRLKHAYARCAGAPSMCLVQIVHRGQRRIIDVGATLYEIMAPFVVLVADALALLLGEPSAPQARAHGRQIILTGGGALMPGLGPALNARLRARGYPVERVVIPDDAAELAVRGGWQVAAMLRASHWDVLV
jgi:hypothetical protein